MPKVLIRWFINAIGLYLAIGTGWISGIEAEDTGVVAILALAFVFGIINVFVRPLLKLLTCPVILLTLGLFTLVINGFMLYLAASVIRGVEILGFGWAVLGALLLSLIGGGLNALVKDEGGVEVIDLKRRKDGTWHA